MAKKALIPENFKKKQSELFEIDGTYFRVIYQPKAGLNRLEDWVEKLSKREYHGACTRNPSRRKITHKIRG